MMNIKHGITGKLDFSREFCYFWISILYTFDRYRNGLENDDFLREFYNQNFHQCKPILHKCN